MSMNSASPPDRPWLSVAMPVHCGERWLANSLHSVAAQNCSGVELLILDSSTGDACRDIVDSFRDRLDIHYEHVPDVKSWQAKTNLAVERASASHVAMLHQDDLWLPDRTTELREAINVHPHAVLLLNPSHIVDERGRRLGLWRCPLPSNRPLHVADVAEHLLVQNFISIPAPVIQKRAWLACGGLDEALWYTADWDLYLKLVRHGPAVYLPKPTTAFRVHGNSLTVSRSGDSSDFKQQMQIVLERHRGLVPQRRRRQAEQRAEASIAVNCALAQASHGSRVALFQALGAVVALGPTQAIAYLQDSRIVERAVPRFRARLAGSF
jgi:hypothetical protein